MCQLLKSKVMPNSSQNEKARIDISMLKLLPNSALSINLAILRTKNNNKGLTHSSKTSNDSGILLDPSDSHKPVKINI